MKLQRDTVGHGGAPTLGRMTSKDGTFSCVTLERSVDGDHPCVPAKVYTVHRAMHHPGTPHEYPCPELDTSDLVPVRTHIQIHVANRVIELFGCIATGDRVSDDRQAIEGSQDAFDRLMAYLGDLTTWELEIADPPSAAEG